jgi:hypothetical protein
MKDLAEDAPVSADPAERASADDVFHGTHE